MAERSVSAGRHVAVLGAGGRVGRAVTAAVLREAHHVTAVVRDPARHAVPHHAQLRTVPGDARYPRQLASVLRTVDAVVVAVTPFTAPPESFDGFDLDYYARIVAGIDAHWRRSRRRLVAVGLTATLRLDSGRTVMDDPALFPPRLRPFAEAHQRQLSALENVTGLDWAILAPPAGFGDRAPEAEPEYELVAEPVTLRQATARLSHGRYAQAVAAELTEPTVHQARVAVVPRG
jgi:uncharacterized protein